MAQIIPNPFTEISQRLEAIELLLIEIRHGNRPVQPSESKYLKAKEASKYLRLSLQSLYRLTSTEQIPFTKKHKALLFKTEDLDRWLASGKTISNS
ncbi:helix-turn-helix domain-containing protein [Chryseolinea sp. H1M3-3]|uniref:helix-turn-helix domain-containing protein n=1 Tax=Chryseolinea sp. H1M3-3 TaxID=3034144 RepID=UPI0023EBE99C|nr:helix-turn-helix domain-containing protein [Chryseolinea sp. H1M3-3]